MRNLKRALSLTLASVMLLGMMVVGSSAVGYPDVTEEENIEAIEVLQEVGVMEGDNNGNFNPDDYVTREQMAVIMSKLLNLDYNYYQGTNPFSDVPAWAAPYVAACAANGITSGIGGGMYGAGQNVNAVQAALMMLKALGYFQYQDDFGDSYILATVKQATEVGLFDNIDSNAQSALTRNEVAQMALNALQADMVSFTGDVGTKIPTANGDVVVGYRSEYTSRTSTMSKYQAIERRSSDVGGNNNLNRGQYYIQLGEELYNGDLVLYDYSDDDFMRPSRTWEYKGNEIGTYMKKENIRETYTAAVTNRTLYDLLGRSSLETYTVSYYVDGMKSGTSAETANAILGRTSNDFGYTGRGVLTQVFVDTVAGTIDITSIHTWLAKAAVDYNKTTESVILGVYADVTGTNTTALTTTTVNKTVSLADVPEIETVAKDEFVLVTISGKTNGDISDLQTLQNYQVVTVEEPEVMTDSTLTKFSKRSSDSNINSNQDRALFNSVVSDGTEYKSSNRAYYSDEVLDLYDENRLVNKTYNVYLDKYGYAIGIDLYSGDDNYVFITGFDSGTSNIALGSAKAAAIFTDGTMRTIDVNVRDTNKNIEKVSGDGEDYFEEWAGRGMASPLWTINRWYTYTVDANGEYTLNPAARMFTTEVIDKAADTADDLVIKCNSVRIDENAANVKENGDAKGRNIGRAYGNDNSVFIVVDVDEEADNSDANIISDVAGVYTGVQSVEIEVTGKENKGTVVNTTKIDGTDLYDSIYTLYDKNNYIIASVIVGEAKGSDANYAYILTAAKSEERLSDGTTVWEFDAIVDGKITTLRTNSKFTKVIKDLEPGHIQELRYTGEYVTGVKTPTGADKYYDKTEAFSKRINDEDIYDVGHAFRSGWANDCAVSTSDAHNAITNDGNRNHLIAAQAPDLRVEGNTMYLGNGTLGADFGLALVPDAPAVVLHRVDNDNEKVECASVAQAIAELGDATPNDTSKKGFAGRIVAVLDDTGRAKWVVFISETKVETTPGGSVPVGPSGDVRGNITVVADNIGAKNIVTSVSRDGELTIAIPVPAGTTSATVDMQVTVDGIARSMGSGTVIGNQLVFTSTDLNLDSSNNVVITITGKPTTVSGDTAFENVGSSTSKTEVQNALDRLGNATNNDGDPIKGELNVSGNVDLKGVVVPNNVEVKVPAGSSITLDSNSIAPGASVSGAGDVVVAGNVDFANIHVGGTVTVGNGGVISTTDSAIVGPGSTGVDIVLDGGSIANGTEVTGAVTIKSNLTIDDDHTFSANQIDVEAGVTVTCDLSDVPANVVNLAEGAIWKCDLGGGAILTVAATTDICIIHGNKDSDDNTINAVVNGVEVTREDSGASGFSDAFVYACQNGLLA